MKDLLCAIKTFLLSLFTARDVIIAGAFFGFGYFADWLRTRPQRKKDDAQIKKNDERWEWLRERFPETTTNTSRGLADAVWEIARPGEPVPLWVQVKMDSLAA